MNKKEFYEAPEWGLRVLMLERKPICTSGYGENAEAGGIMDVTDMGDSEEDLY